MADYDPLDRMSRTLRGSNPLPPRTPMGSMAGDLGRFAQAAPAAPAGPAGPGNPRVPPGGSAEARAFQESRTLRGAAPGTSTPVQSTLQPTAPAAQGQTGLRARAMAGGGQLAGRATRALGPAAVGASAMSHLGDYGIDDPGVDSSASGTWNALRQEGLGALFNSDSATRRGLSKGLLEAGMDVGSMGANALDLVVPGKAPVSGAYNSMLHSTFGDQLIDNSGQRLRDPAANPATPAAQPSAASARDPYAQANADKIAQASAAHTAPTSGDITRVGNSYSGGNVSGDVTINGRAPGGGAISAENMAAADNLAARETLRGQGWQGMSQYDREVANAQATNAMQQRLYSKPEGTVQNGLMSRTPDQQRRDAAVSASSIHGRTAELGQAELKALDQQTQDRLRANTENYRTDQSLAGAKYGEDSRAASSKYAADSSLRGDFAKAGADRRGAALKQQENAAYGTAFQQAGGDPVKAAQIAAGMGLDPSRYTGMAAADQTRGHHAANNATQRLEGLAVRPDGKGGTEVDKGRLAQLRSTATKMAPGWEGMSEKDQAQHLGKVEASVNLLEGMNSRRNNSFWQSLGLDGKSPSLDALPNMQSAKLTPVGLREGATTGGGVSRGDYKVEVNGHTLYLPRDKVNAGELALLKERGVDISGAEK